MINIPLAEKFLQCGENLLSKRYVRHYRQRIVMMIETRLGDRIEVFLRLLLISELYAPSGSGDPVNFRAISRNYGITLHHAEFEILEQTRIGNSQICIAKYSLSYSYDTCPPGERVYIEGTVTSQIEEPGNIHINILSNVNPLRNYFPPEHSEISPVGEEICSRSVLSCQHP